MTVTESVLQPFLASCRSISSPPLDPKAISGLLRNISTLKKCEWVRKLSALSPRCLSFAQRCAYFLNKSPFPDRYPHVPWDACLRWADKQGWKSVGYQRHIWPHTEIFRAKEVLLGLSTFIKEGNFTLAFRSSSRRSRTSDPGFIILHLELGILNNLIILFFRCEYPTFHVRLKVGSKWWKFVG